MAIFFLIQLVIFNGKSCNTLPIFAEIIRYLRRDGFVDFPLVELNNIAFLMKNFKDNKTIKLVTILAGKLQ